jgi:hypothetical protein
VVRADDSRWTNRVEYHAVPRIRYDGEAGGPIRAMRLVRILDSAGFLVRGADIRQRRGGASPCVAAHLRGEIELTSHKVKMPVQGDVPGLRARLGMSQARFAGAFGLDVRRYRLGNKAGGGPESGRSEMAGFGRKPAKAAMRVQATRLRRSCSRFAERSCRGVTLV